MKTNLKKLQPSNKTPIHTVDISPKGEQFVLGQQGDESGNANLTLWSVKDLRVVSVLEKQMYEIVYKARYSPDGKYLAYVDTTNKVRLYNFETQDTHQLDLQNLNIKWLDYSKKCNRLAVAGSFAQVWDENLRQVIWVSPDNLANRDLDDAIATAAISPDGARVAVSGVEENKILIYDVVHENLVQTLEEAPRNVHWLSFAPHGQYLAAIGGYSRGTFLWDLGSGEKHLPKIFNQKSKSYWCLSFAPNGEYLAFGMLSGYVVIVRLEDGEFAFDQRVHEGRVWDIAFSADGNYLLSGGDDATAYIWELDWTH